MIEWLERLGCGAESRRKACVRGWVTFPVNPAVTFSN